MDSVHGAYWMRRGHRVPSCIAIYKINHPPASRKGNSVNILKFV